MKTVIKYLQRYIFASVAMILVSLNLVTGQEREVSLMFYNVENFFDTIDCDLDDDEFLPGGVRRWNSYRYYTKINNLFKVIVASGGWSPPAVIGLCEVENINVLNDLIRYTYLSRRGYRAFYADSYDERGIGVGILIDTTVFTANMPEIIYPVDINGDFITTRSILSVRIFNENDSLSLVVTHWPSRRGGAMATEILRESVALMIRNEVDKIRLKRGNSEKIIIMGDLNCEPVSEIITDILNAGKQNGRVYDSLLYNISGFDRESLIGTYKYQGVWSVFDQVIISGSLLAAGKGYRIKDSGYRIVNMEALLVDDERFNGVKPFSTWSGPRYLGGFSDHLPVIIDLESVPSGR